ncbi:hypothetical protein V5O48_015481 [Marasmius crinis-equi]|uniref:F-box protein n=1 Tax=Marasmius crinis-equi TaxID=585013 RepID=A0ABR3EUF4_9AGAR
MPLSLKINTCEYDRYINGALGQHLSRAACLELRCPSTFGMVEVLRTATRPAPLLHSLQLSIPNGWDDVVMLTLPDDFLGGIAPNLRRVSFDDCILPWDSPLLKHLTHLEVMTSSAPTQELSVSRLAAILSDCPDLEVLKMWDCLSTTRETGDISPVELPRLRSLDIVSGIPVLLEILTKFKIPSAAHIELGCDIDEGIVSAPDVARILGLSLRSTEKTKEISFLSLDWDCSTHRLTCLAWNNTLFEDNMISDAFFGLHLTFPSDASPFLMHYTDAFLDATVLSTSLCALRMVRLNDVELSPRGVRRLAGLCGLQALELSNGQTFKPFIEALGQALGTDGGMSFPALMLLHLKNVAFGPQPSAIPDKLKARMFESLSTRVGRGSSILALTLECCEGLFEEDIEKMKELVPDFEQV